MSDEILEMSRPAKEEFVKMVTDIISNIGFVRINDDEDFNNFRDELIVAIMEKLDGK